MLNIMKIMMLERKGMFDSFSNHSDLEARWEYSSSLAKRINESKLTITPELKSSIDDYFQKLKKIGTSDDLFYDSINNRLKPIHFDPIRINPIFNIGFCALRIILLFNQKICGEKISKRCILGVYKAYYDDFHCRTHQFGDIFLFTRFNRLAVVRFVLLLIPMWIAFIFQMRFWQRVLLVSEIKEKTMKI